MMRDTETALLVFRGHAQTMPGELWTLVHPDGEEREFLFDSAFEAQTFAAYFGRGVQEVRLAYDMPPETDPRKALDYSNIRESMYVPEAKLTSATDAGPRQPKLDAMVNDWLRPGDMGGER